jgi:hypothetical protein
VSDLLERLDAAIGGPDRRTKDGRRTRKYTPLKVETQLLVDARAEVVRVRDLCETIEGQVRTIWGQSEEIERLRQEKLVQSECIESLRAFARLVLQVWPDGDLDGGELQEAAIAAGLLRKADPPPREPCGENCRCAEYYVREEFERGAVTCYRRAREVLGDA